MCASALKAHRLVTLTGVGGVGKTRLALEVAARSAPDFPDGVWVIELAAVGDPAAVPDAVAGVLGITQQPGMTLTDSVAAALEGRSRLLVFDNCEHVLDAAADMVEAILSRSATVKILATSREGLRAADEQLWPVPSLDTRAESDSAAATLFVERAEAVVPGVSLDPVAVVEICRRLDGIPLGIELAASRMVSMTVTEVRDRLNDRFRLLVGSRRGLERHQTLRHAVQWSYDLLDEDEQTLLNRCSVFAGGFDLAGACAVAGSEDEFATLDLLDALVRKSLLVADRSSGRTRFSMLETIRQFAEDQLAADGQAEETRDAHARYFADLEADVFALWDSPRQREAYEWFTVELAEPARRVPVGRRPRRPRHRRRHRRIRGFLGTSGRAIRTHRMGRGTHRTRESRRTSAGSQRFTSWPAQCCWIGRIDERYSVQRERSAPHRRRAFRQVSVWLRGESRRSLHTVGQPERWADVARRQLEHTDDSHGHVRASLAMALALAGAQDEAIGPHGRSRRTAESTHNPYSLAQALLAVGLAYRYTDPPTALAALRRALEIAQASGNRFNESHIAVVAVPRSKRNTAPQKPRSTTSRWRSATTSTRETSRRRAVRWPSSPACWTGSATMSRRPPSPTSPTNPLTRMAFPEITTTIAHLREVLGDDRYESLAQVGQAMTNAAMANYAFEQIDLARARAQRSDNADLSTSSGRPPRSRARRWNSFNDSPRPTHLVAQLLPDPLSDRVRRGLAGPAEVAVQLEAEVRFGHRTVRLQEYPRAARHPKLRRPGRSCRSARRCR